MQCSLQHAEWLFSKLCRLSYVHFAPKERAAPRKEWISTATWDTIEGSRQTKRVFFQGVAGVRLAARSAERTWDKYLPKELPFRKQKAKELRTA